MDLSNEADDRGRIPNLVQIGAIGVDTEMDMDQEVLDPVVNGQNFCRFVLSNKGFLHSFSKITLGVSGNGSGTFPVGIGVDSLIQRCALRIGTTIVAETDDWSSLQGYKSMFIDNDINLERETYLTSRILNHDFTYINSAGAESNVNASGLSLATYLEPNVNAIGSGGNLKSQKEIRSGNAPVFQVSVADLFPFLRFNQLPLYMIDEQISIELTFQPASTFKRCIHTKTAEAQGQTFNIDETQTKFVASYIYYDGEMMEQYRSQNPVLEWTYNDFRLNKRSYTSAQLLVQQTLEVGGAGRLVGKVVTALEKTSLTPDTSMLSVTTSEAPTISSGNNGIFTTNLLLNDHRLYPMDRVNPALHFHDVVQAEQNVPHIIRDEFNRQGVALSSTYTYMNYVQSSAVEGLNGRYHYIAYRPTRNERINSKGLQLELKYSNVTAAETFIHRSWLELVKTARLENGRFSSEYV